MKVLVDTSVWSLALRRKPEHLSPQERSQVQMLAGLAAASRIQVIGAVRQEVLTGLRDPAQYIKLRDAMREFPNVILGAPDYEEAATMSNRCRAHGVSGSATDLLLCAVAARNQWSIFTTDRDFDRYSRVLGVKLFST